MISVLSATEHDFYAMPLPFAVYSWNKIGINAIVFIPNGDNKKLDLVKRYCADTTLFYEFHAEEKRIPTFSQVSRLFGAAIKNIKYEETLITADADICVFGNLFSKLNDGGVHIVGADLTPDEQYPMCFAAMPKFKWGRVMNINKDYQTHLEEIINPIEGENVRGTNWCLDQFLLKRNITNSGLKVFKHNRSNGQNQWALNRADRDGWHFDVSNIIDAHLPRPLTDEGNFNKVYELFKIKYPNDNLQWMIDYRNQYLKLL